MRLARPLSYYSVIKYELQYRTSAYHLLSGIPSIPMSPLSRTVRRNSGVTHTTTDRNIWRARGRLIRLNRTTRPTDEPGFGCERFDMRSLHIFPFVTFFLSRKPEGGDCALRSPRNLHLKVTHEFKQTDTLCDSSNSSRSS